MASICGVELKNIKTFKGHESESCYQASVYLNGKRLGTVVEDTWGASNHYDFNTTELDNIAKYVATTDLVDPRYRIVFEVDSLLHKVLCLAQDEKQYKSFCKQGYPCMLVVTDGYNCFYSATRDIKARVDKSYALSIFENEIKKCKSKCFKNEPIKVNIYNSLEDFKISL